MKHLKTFFAFMLMAVLSIGQVWGDEAEYVITSQSLAVTLNGKASTGWTITSGSFGGYDATKGAQTTATSFVITCPETYSNVTSIVVFYSTNNKSTAKISAAVGEQEADQQQVEKSKTNSSLTFSFADAGDDQAITVSYNKNGTSGSLYIKKIVITYTSSGSGSDDPTIKAVQFTPDGGTFANSKSVTLSQEDNKAIYYTTNATAGAGDPSTSSPWSAYTSALTLTESTTIYAAAKDGDNWSSVTSKTFTIYSVDHAGTQEDPYSVADARTAIDANAGITNVYATGIVSAIVTEYSSQYSNITFDISIDGETNSDQLRAYRCSGTDAANVIVGDVVVVSGSLVNYNSIYEFSQGCTIVSLEHPASAGGVITAPESVEVPAAGEEDGSISISFTNIDVENVENVAIFNDAEHANQYTGDWLVAAWNNNKTAIEYTVAANENTAARTAYIYLYALDNNGDEVEKVISVTQAEYVAPFSGLELTFPDEGNGGNNISSYTATWSAVIGTQTWSIYGFNTNKWEWNPAVIKTGRKNNSGTAQPLTATIETQVVDHAVGDIVVTIDAVAATLVTSHKLYVADNSDYTDAIEIDGDPYTIAAGNITYTVPSANRANDLYYKLEYATAGTGSSNGILTISKITYAYANATPQKQSTGLAFEDADKNNLVKVGANFTAPTLTNPNKLTGITYASSDANIVAVDASTGALTIKAAGKAVITASRGEDETYKAGSASYTIYVAAEAGTAADPLSETSAKTLIDLGCTMEVHVNGVVQGEQDATKFTVTLAGGLQFYKLKDLGNIAFETAYIGNGDEVTAVGSLLKYNNTYELAEGCYLTSYTKYEDPAVILKQSGSIVEILNVAATSVDDQEIDIVCANFGSQITSISTKLYGESSCYTEITSEWVTNIAVAGAKLTFSVADNDGDARQVWMKVTAGDGTDEASAVLNISQAKYIPDFAELPFEFDGGKANIATTSGMSQEGLGSDYNSSPKLKFDGTGDVVIIKMNAAPGTLTYDIKGNTFSDGTFKVQQSADGEDYDDVAEYTELGSLSESKTLAPATRYIKFIYTKKANGNVALGNIAISEYVAPAVKPTITTQPVGAEYLQDATATALTIVAEAGNSGTLSYQWYSNSSESTEGAAAIVGADDDEYTPSTASVGTIYYYCVVTEAGADETTTSSIVAVVVNAAPVVMTDYYEKVTSTAGITEGTYLIVYEDASVAFDGSLDDSDGHKLDKASNTIEVEITSDHKIGVTSATAAATFYIDPTAGTIQAASGKYIGATSYSNSLASGETGYAHTNMSIDEGNAIIYIQKEEWNNNQNGKMQLCYNDASSQYRFRYFKEGSQKAIQLYKLANEVVKADPALSWSESSVELTVGGNFTAPTLSHAQGFSGTISYSSDNEEVATVTDAGVISLVENATGTAHITASFNGDDDYKAATTKCTIKVNPAHSIYVDKLTVNFNSVEKDAEVNDKTITVTLTNVEAATATLAGDGASAFNITPTTLTASGDITISASTANVGTFVATITISDDASEAAEKVVNLSITVTDPEAVETAVSTTSEWVAATDADLVDGKEVLITGVRSNKTYAMGEQSTNNRVAVEASVDGEGVLTPGENTMSFTLVAQDNGKFALRASNGKFLYAASSSKNYLKLQATIDDNAKWTLTATSAVANGTNSNKYMKLNNSSDIFSCYGSGQIAIKFYVPKPAPKYSVTYAAGEGSGNAPDAVEYVQGATFTVAAANLFTAPNGKEFDKWNDGTDDYAPGATYTVGTSNVVLTAQWKDAAVTPDPEPETPDYTREVTANRYGTICIPQGGRMVDAILFEIAWHSVGEQKIYFDEIVDGRMVPGRPYIFWPKNTTIGVIYSEEDEAEEAGSYNGLVGSFADAILEANDGNYILYNSNFYLVDVENKVKVGANKAYVKLDDVRTTEQPQAPGRRRVSMGVQGEQVATDMLNAELNAQPMKVIIDNQLIIIREGKMYDMTGNLVK